MQEIVLLGLEESPAPQPLLRRCDNWKRLLWQAAAVQCTVVSTVVCPSADVQTRHVLLLLLLLSNDSRMQAGPRIWTTPAWGTLAAHLLILETSSVTSWLALSIMRSRNVA